MFINFRSILFKITASIVLTISVVVTALYVLLGQISANQLSEFKRYNQDSLTVLWSKTVDSQLARISAATSDITRNRTLQKYFQSQKWEDSLPDIEKVYRRLAANQVINGLVITDVLGKPVLTIPRGLSLKTTLIDIALKDRSVQTGIHHYKDNRLVFGTSFPILRRGKLVAGGIFLSDISQSIVDFKSHSKNDIFLYAANNSLQFHTDDTLKRLMSKYNLKASIGELQAISDGEKFLDTASADLIPGNQSGNRIVFVHDVTKEMGLHSSKTTLLIGSIVVAVFIIGLFVAKYIHIMLRPLRTIVSELEKVAIGDLTGRLSVSGNNEMSDALNAIRAMVGNLRSMVVSISEPVQQLLGATKNIHKTAKENISGTLIQHSNIETVNQSISEGDNLLNALSDLIARSSTYSHEASTSAGLGKSNLDDVKRHIDELSRNITNSSDVILNVQQHSNNISNILDVIHDISEQTNLLALNAAIEAARAGEQGRGFAVVADEVRALASRSKESTAQIQLLIEKLQKSMIEAVESMELSQTKTRSSVEEMQVAQQSFVLITDKISDVSTMSERIEKILVTQTQTAQVIRENVEQVGEVADKTASNAKRNQDSSENLVVIAEDLNRVVGQFKL